ncbi:MAG: hypothetical protein J6K43_07410 [Lachnospiraceae bacterium]|nr:hypothetical protein [Lachnospiraceae bacterium]
MKRFRTMGRWKQLIAIGMLLMLVFSTTACRLIDLSKLVGTESTEDAEDTQNTGGWGNMEEQPNTTVQGAQRPVVNISETKAQQLQNSLVSYSDPNGTFTAMIPEGWAVSTAGYDMMYWIRIYDPENPDLQVFTLLKTECLLMDQNSKDFYQAYGSLALYATFADMIVVEEVDDFYENFMDFCAFMATYEPTYEGFEYPQINNFETLEKFPLNSFMADVALEDTIIHGTFDDNYTGAKGEGMFTGTLCRGFVANGVGCNMMYNISAITAPYGELSEYEAVLSQILGSVQYTDVFVQTVMVDQQIKAAGAAQVNQTMQETSDIITQGWYARQTSYDIISEKQSDAILGYERVYDVETGEVYRAYDGFTGRDDINGFYEPVTDDMYSEPLSGYINE